MDQQDSSPPRPWGDPREAVRDDRSTVLFIFVLAVMFFAVAAFVDWPTDKAEVCGKLRTLQSASGSIEHEITDLKDVAEDYRGVDQDAVRADADRIGDDLMGGSGWKWLGRDDIDKATGSIRALCGDGPASS